MVFRERRRSRHRAVDAGPGEAIGDHELESFLAAISPEAGCSTSELTGRFGSAQVFQLRLPALRIEQLRRLAEAEGVPPGALVVDWVIERLDHEDPDPHLPAPRRPEPERGRRSSPVLSALETLTPSGELTPVLPWVPTARAEVPSAALVARPSGARHRAPRR